MPIWATSPVDEQPTLSLVRWQVFQLPNGDRHFVGYALENAEGRVSTAVRDLDLRLLRGVTATGRVYCLLGAPGIDGDGQYVWRRWLDINGLADCKDVTAEVWENHCKSVGAKATRF